MFGHIIPLKPSKNSYKFNIILQNEKIIFENLGKGTTLLIFKTPKLFRSINKQYFYNCGYLEMTVGNKIDFFFFKFKVK